MIRLLLRLLVGASSVLIRAHARVILATAGTTCRRTIRLPHCTLTGAATRLHRFTRTVRVVLTPPEVTL